MSVCRLCICESCDTGFVYLFNSYFDDSPASTFITDIFHVDINSEQSSQNNNVLLCQKCFDILNNFYFFFKTVSESQQKYHEIISNRESEIIKNEYDDLIYSDYLDGDDSFNIKTIQMDDVKSGEFHFVNTENSQSKSDDDNNSENEAVESENVVETEVTTHSSEPVITLDPATRSQVATEIVLKKYRVEDMLRGDKFTLNRQQLDEVFNMYFDMKCEFCTNDYIFSSHKELANHSVCEHDAPSRVKCCNYYAKNQVQMETHIIYKHIAPAKSLPLKTLCKVCNKMISLMGMRNHLLNHTPPEQRKYKCQHCPLGFAKACMLKNHTEMSHLAEAVKCELCNKSYKNKICLMAHTRRMHTNVNQDFLCPECGKSYKDLVNYKAHMKKHSGEEEKVKCPKCDAVVKQQNLHYHLRRHEPDKKKQCPYCPYKATRALSEHIQRVHEKVKKFACTICPMKFYKEREMKDHISSRHTGIPEYECKFCGKTFMNSGNYHVHRKKQHPQELAELKLEKIKGNLEEEIPVYDPEAPKKKTVQQGIEADEILKNTKRKKYTRRT